MRNAFVALCAASLCALAAPAMAQQYPSYTGAPAYRYTGPVGSCEMLSGNRVCTDTPAQYGYGYGPAGELIAAPVAIVTAPFGFLGGSRVASSGATYAPATGAGTYSYESHVPPQPGAVGYCDLISGNRVCF